MESNRPLQGAREPLPGRQEPLLHSSACVSVSGRPLKGPQMASPLLRRALLDTDLPESLGAEGASPTALSNAVGWPKMAEEL